ncbi:hypothetical protein IKF43_01510 [Candidatus Saccharibacteria bacterium]|nr:hypothetical protein [Candidatus Saccharibacteria bacterium]
MTKCKKANELKSFEEIGVSQAVISLMGDHFPISGVILSARVGTLADDLAQKIEDPDQARNCYLEIQNALNKAGYIRHDFNEYQTSFNWLALIIGAMSGNYDESFTDEQSNIYRGLKYFSNEKYEQFVGTSESIMEALHAALEAALDDEYGLIKCIFGLKDGICRDIYSIAKILGEEDESVIRNRRDKALGKLIAIFDTSIFKTAFCKDFDV